MIRRAEKKDIGGLMALLRQVNAVHHNLRPDLFKPNTKYDEQTLAVVLQDDSKPIFVFDDEGRILGHAFCQVTEANK